MIDIFSYLKNSGLLSFLISQDLKIVYSVKGEETNSSKLFL